MFDFSRITELITGLTGGSAVTEALQTDGLTGGIGELLQNAGLDPSALAGLDQNEIMALLSEYGVDASLLSETQLGELMNAAGLQDGIAGYAMDFLGGDSGKS